MFDRDYCRQHPEYVSHSLARHQKTRVIDEDDAALVREYLDELKAERGISHAHADHIGGYQTVLSQFPLDRF
jgi:metal-dependent hydrolase (beta-lactamase superfamily II)